jgi:hypothetical protein
VAEYRLHGDNSGAAIKSALRIADEMHEVAWRSRNFFRGRLRMELMHESASWAARSAELRRRRVAWAAWKLRSVAWKLAAMAIPRRPTDQAGAHPSLGAPR